MTLYKFFVILIKIGIFQVLRYNIILFSHPDICRYQKEVSSVIVSHNKLVLANTTLSECYHVCNSSTQVTCRSFEYNAENQVCQISDVNKWTESQYFLQDVRGWDYYHRKCYFGKYCENIFHNFFVFNVLSNKLSVQFMLYFANFERY